MLAMYTIQWIILIVGLIAIIFSLRKAPPLAFAIVFMLILFSKTILTYESEEQANFYLFGTLFWGMMTIWLQDKFNTQSDSTADNKIKGWGFELYSVFLAIGIYFGARILGGLAKGEILGTPQLAIGAAGSVKETVLLALAPLMSAAHGIVENGLFLACLVILVMNNEAIIKSLIALFEWVIGWIALIPWVGIFIVMMINAFILPLSQILIMLAPYLIISMLFGFFHLIAYRIIVEKLIWAAMVMGIMLLSYKMANNDMTPMNLFHAWWNGDITIDEGLSIMGG